MPTASRMHQGLRRVRPFPIRQQRQPRARVAVDVVVEVEEAPPPPHQQVVAKTRQRAALEAVAAHRPPCPRVVAVVSRASGIAAFQCRIARP